MLRHKRKYKKGTTQYTPCRWREYLQRREVAAKEQIDEQDQVLAQPLPLHAGAGAVPTGVPPLDAPGDGHPVHARFFTQNIGVGVALSP